MTRQYTIHYTSDGIFCEYQTEAEDIYKAQDNFYKAFPTSNIFKIWITSIELGWSKVKSRIK